VSDTTLEFKLGPAMQLKAGQGASVTAPVLVVSASGYFEIINFGVNTPVRAGWVASTRGKRKFVVTTTDSKYSLLVSENLLARDFGRQRPTGSGEATSPRSLPMKCRSCLAIRSGLKLPSRSLGMPMRSRPRAG
jgi:hypothetical protein